MRSERRLFQLLASQPACLVTVQASRGSVPREAGTWMAVLPHEVIGTIGGGQLELQAVERARHVLMGTHPPLPSEVRFALGPNLGQCCGGDVHLAFERITVKDIAWLEDRLRQPLPPVALFGGGHVGKALVQVLGALPLSVTWIDSRDEIFPPIVPDNVVCEHSDPVQRAVSDLSAGAAVLIMSFSHAEDLDVVAACLLRQRIQADLAFIGLIGSKTKWATFRSRLLVRGFSDDELTGVTCPIGVPGITAKEPEVIAVSVAAQILQVVSKRGA